MHLTLPYPPSTNRAWRTAYVPKLKRAVVYPSKEYTEYKEWLGRMVKIKGMIPLAGPVEMIARLYRPAKRGDLMNPIKVLCDALQGVAYLNDDQIVRAHVEMYDDKDHPRVEVEVTAHHGLEEG